MIKISNTYSGLMKRWRLYCFPGLFFIGAIFPAQLLAHQSPNSLVFLDVSPDRVAMEIQLPVPELELAFANDISKSPETIIDNYGNQLKEYLKKHLHAYITQENPWTVEISSMVMDKGSYIESGLLYWEVIAHILLKPGPGEDTRKFILDYDIIMHQVINHVALMSVRSDWETGNFNKSTAEPIVISRNISDNVIYPTEISLEKGSRWKGFKSMVWLGIRHIKEGTDHLLFLLVLLLPALLLVNRKGWGRAASTKDSLSRLLKVITAFTIGHSLTLLIGALGWMKLPQQPVEILIAFSILVSAVHALYPIFPGKEMYVAAGFGLVHGLAFATILSNLNLGAGALALSILGFNMGIELMQLCIVILIIPWLILLSKTDNYKIFRIAAAVLAAIAAMAWVAERSSGQGNFITEITAKMPEHGLWYILAVAIISLLSFLLASYFRVKRYGPLKKV